MCLVSPRGTDGSWWSQHLPPLLSLPQPPAGGQSGRCKQTATGQKKKKEKNESSECEMAEAESRPPPPY